MSAGQKHHAVGTMHIKVGHAIVFEKSTDIEDTDGTKDHLKTENKVVNWDEAKELLTKGELDALASIQKKLIPFDDEREKAAADAKAKAEAEAKAKAEKKSSKDKE